MTTHNLTLIQACLAQHKRACLHWLITQPAFSHNCSHLFTPHLILLSIVQDSPQVYKYYLRIFCYAIFYILVYKYSQHGCSHFLTISELKTIAIIVRHCVEFLYINSRYQTYRGMNMKKYLEEMLKYNEQFVAEKEYEQYKTDSFPNTRMVIFTCMESRLVELLP